MRVQSLGREKRGKEEKGLWERAWGRRGGAMVTVKDDLGCGGGGRRCGDGVVVE